MRTVLIKAGHSYTLEHSYVNRLDYVYANNETERRLIAVQGAYGMSGAGWHLHSENINGDWPTLEQAITSQGYLISMQ